MSDDTTLLESATALRPTKDYEDITIRQVSIGFSGGHVEDMTLYPEDDFVADDQGNIKVVFHTIDGGEFVAYAGHTQWHSYREVAHKRERGTKRPDPAQIAREARERRERGRLERMQQLMRDADADE